MAGFLYFLGACAMIFGALAGLMGYAPFGVVGMITAVFWAIVAGAVLMWMAAMLNAHDETTDLLRRILQSQPATPQRTPDRAPLEAAAPESSDTAPTLAEEQANIDARLRADPRFSRYMPPKR